MRRSAVTDPRPIKTYVLNFFQPNPNWNIQGLHNYIRESKAFVGWSNRLPMVYYLMSRLTAPEIRTRLVPIFAGGNFIVAEIDRFNMDGLMPQDAWDWFYSIERAAALPSPPPIDLGSPQEGWSKYLTDILSKPTGLLAPPKPTDVSGGGLSAYEDFFKSKKP
jgi:hypothetical protein